jgi:sigma-E factor negative regulatory protein RseA
MKQQVSAFMDGELDRDAINAVIAKLREEDEEIRSNWWTYHVIGEALRQDPLCHLQLHQKVLQSLAQEPTVLSPRASKSTWKPRLYVGLAASVTTVALVAWMTTLNSPVAPKVIADSTQVPVEPDVGPYYHYHQGDFRERNFSVSYPSRPR